MPPAGSAPLSGWPSNCRGVPKSPVSGPAAPAANREPPAGVAAPPSPPGPASWPEGDRGPGGPGREGGAAGGVDRAPEHAGADVVAVGELCPRRAVDHLGEPTGIVVDVVDGLAVRCLGRDKAALGVAHEAERAAVR